MRFESGKVWFSRRMVSADKHENDFYKDGPLFLVWSFLILRANWKDGSTMAKNFSTIVRRGQVLTSVKEIAEQWNLGQQVIKRCLSWLEKTGRINQQTNQRGRLITVIKYDDWQTKKDIPTSKPTTSQPTANQQPTNSQPYSEEGNKGIREEENNKTSSKKRVAITEWDKSISGMLAEAIMSNNPKSIRLSEAKIKNWADTFRKMREVDKLDEGDIERTLDFTFMDDFWSGVVQSATGFRRNWNKITSKMGRNGGSLHDKARRIDELFDSGKVQSLF